ncbi:MAG: leucyl aminopeptidase [Planctomycetales bacterium]|nr:leucyl aminopeptidase [Planctomycetales bacterium]
MEVVAGTGAAADCQCSALAVVAYDTPQLSGSVAVLDQAAAGLFQRLHEQGDLPTQQGQVGLFYQVPGVVAPCVAVVGGGSPGNFDEAAAFRCGGTVSKRLAERMRQAIALDFGPLSDSLATAAIAGALNGAVGQDLFRAEKTIHPMERLHVWGIADAALQRGGKMGRGMLLARELVNLPPNLMTPEIFTRRAAGIAVSCGLELEVWDELRLRREQCGALLAVAAGSARPPRLLILRYPGKKKQPPLALVGKGVTFDSGGLSLKPTEGMLAMKCDMAGAASVLAAMQTIAELEVESPVVAVLGLVENMISGTSYKLGDVLTARSGKTIEIHNTDAEGRLVLADALNVALDEKPAQLVDVATLTGACLVALGLDIAGLMSNDATWQAQLQQAASEVGELVWPLPMHAHFSEQVQSKVADIKNVGEGRWGGAITAAKFLEEFVGQTPWAHLDIAGPAFRDAPKPFMDAGASGALVRTLVALAESL